MKLTANNTKTESIVLAYSGGLDTTAIIPWLREHYKMCKIIACCVDAGQCGDYSAIEKAAIETGADKVYVIDARDEFASDFIFPMIKANAVYEGKYLLGTSAARPLIAKKLIDVALLENASAICHGATGKGNDQLRFELTIKAFAPWLTIIAPWRIWNIKSREDAMDYLRERGIKIPMAKNQSYSRDQNLWHLSHEGLELEDPSIEPDYRHLLQMSVSPEDAPDCPEYVQIEFEKGAPVKLDGNIKNPAALIGALNVIGGRNGVGIADMVENRVVGLKSRGVYETPGGSIIFAAHRELESLCLDRQTTAFKAIVAQRLSELIYAGEWYTPLRDALSAFVDVTQENVSGVVRLKLYKGNIIPAGVSSPYSLYNKDLSSFATGDVYDHKDAEGFIKLSALPMTVRAYMKKEQNL
ncbi:MAG: argininosuccinate synthase [Oscillospiraceae bacterium]|nr:argininosuccinate synthase [Oscillospiraceae bacterium]